MKTTIDKTITVLQKLTPKYTNLSTKLNEVILSQEENSTLNIKLDEILALVNSNSSSESGTDAISDLVALGILPKQISEFTDDDIGTIISIPYTDESGNISGPIEFEIVGVNHHKDINDESKPTITLMTKNVIRTAAFDAKEPNNPLFDELFGNNGRAEAGNNRWSVSNIRQWLNSNGAANEWFIAQHDYDEAPTADKVADESGAYADESGFLTGFSDEVKHHFATIRNKTALCNADKSLLSKDFEETEDKVFLASYTEMFGYDNNGIAEGKHLSVKYQDSSSRNKNDHYYWMRSPYPDCSAYVLRVDSMGLDDCLGAAYSGLFGLAPLIVLC